MSEEIENTALTTQVEASVIQDHEAAEKALALMTKGDLSKLNSTERAVLLVSMAKSLGLNALTKPVDLIPDGRGGIVLYFNKGATDQLRAKHNVNLQVIERYNPTPDTYAVLVRATLPNGRQDESTGCNPLLVGMSPGDKANTIMKTETKAKRRATLSILGLGLPDESEMDLVPIFQQQLQQGIPQNAPRKLQAPAGAQSSSGVASTPVEAEIVAPGGSQEVQPNVAQQPQPQPAQAKPMAMAKPAATPAPAAATVMKKRLPVAPPVDVK